MIDFNTRYKPDDLSPFCEHASYTKVMYNDTESMGTFKVMCVRCNYCAFLGTGNRLEKIQTVVNQTSIWIAKNGTVISGDKYKYLDYPIVDEPYDVKTLSSSVEKLLILL